jgi:hypothetical protein
MMETIQKRLVEIHELTATLIGAEGQMEPAARQIRLLGIQVGLSALIADVKEVYRRQEERVAFIEREIQRIKADSPLLPPGPSSSASRRRAKASSQLRVLPGGLQ